MQMIKCLGFRRVQSPAEKGDKDKRSQVIHWDWLIHIKVISPSTAVSVMYLPRITKRDKLFFICWSTAVGVPKCEQPKLKPAAYFMSVFLEFHELHFVSHE